MITSPFHLYSPSSNHIQYACSLGKIVVFLDLHHQVKPWSQSWLVAAGTYSGFGNMKRLEVFLLPLDGMLVHCRLHPRNFLMFSQQFAGTDLYTWVERGTMRVECLAQEHNAMSPARAWTPTACSGVECANHETTGPPQFTSSSSC